MKKEMAACGLICTGCDMMLATTDKELAMKISAWIKKKQKKEVRPEDIHCGGCHGPRDANWSANCWILLCCVDKKHLDNCSECQDFPCARLKEWAKENKGYGEALKRLRTLKKK
jgi:hypothetical protein